MSKFTIERDDEKNILFISVKRDGLVALRKELSNIIRRAVITEAMRMSKEGNLNVSRLSKMFGCCNQNVHYILESEGLTVGRTIMSSDGEKA